MVSQTKLVYSVFGPIGPIYRNFDLSGRTKNDFALVYFRFLNAPYDQSQIVTICLAPKEIWQVIFHNTQWYHYLEIILDFLIRENGSFDNTFSGASQHF